MTDPLLQNYQAYVHRVRKFQTLGGIRHSNGISAKRSYGVAILPTSLCIVMSFGTLNFCWNNVKSISILTQALSFVCSLIATSLRAFCFAVNRKRVIKLDLILEELFEAELTVNYRKGSPILSRLHEFDKPSSIYSFTVGGTLLQYFIPPLILVLRQLKGYVENDNFPLPFPAKFPWKVEGHGYLYHIHLTFEIAVGWFMFFTNSSIDALFGFYIFHIASVFKAMTFRLTNPLLIDNQVTLLKSCARKHRKLLVCRDILQKIYGPIILWLVLTNGVAMCALIFQASQTKDLTARKFGLYAFYMFLKIFQTFGYAYYGTILTTESEAFREGLYFINWPAEYNKELRSGLSIIMIQRPMTVKALNLFYVCLDMFIKIMNKSVSYFFLLQTLDESA